jgi:hypothetical protein
VYAPVQEGFAPAVQGQPHAVVLDLVDCLGKQVEVHGSLVPVDGAQAGMTQGAFQLADIGGIDLPFVRSTADLLFTKPQLDFNPQEVE